MKPNTYLSKDFWLVKMLTYASISTSAFFYMSGVHVADIIGLLGVA